MEEHCGLGFGGGLVFDFGGHGIWKSLFNFDRFGLETCHAAYWETLNSSLHFPSSSLMCFTFIAILKNIKSLNPD